MKRLNFGVNICKILLVKRENIAGRLLLPLLHALKGGQCFFIFYIQFMSSFRLEVASVIFKEEVFHGALYFFTSCHDGKIMRVQLSVKTKKSMACKQYLCKKNSENTLNFQKLQIYNK